MRNHLRVIPSDARDLLFSPRFVALSLVSLVVVFSLKAQAPRQEPVPLAHGNMPGEPHHHLKIENEYVRVYYVEVPQHEATQLHQHVHDYIYVSLGPADVVNAVLDKPEAHLQLSRTAKRTSPAAASPTSPATSPTPPSATSRLNCLNLKKALAMYVGK